MGLRDGRDPMAANSEIEIARPLPPPRLERGVVAWLRTNLFSEWYDGAFTIASIIVIGAALWFGLRWVIGIADWSVIGTLGGLLVIGQYNTEAACEGLNCFWRPQACLLMVTAVLGMGWGLTGGGLPKRIAILVSVVAALFALLPYSFETMGLDIRLLLVANLPAVGLGWAIGRYTGLGTPRNIAISAVVMFFVALLLLRGTPGIPGIPGLLPVSVIYWGGGLLLLATALLGMAWGLADGGLLKRIAIRVSVGTSLFALLPYSFETMGLDVRLLLVANLLAVGLGWAIGRYTRLGWAIGRYTPLGTPRNIAISAVVLLFVAMVLILLRGTPAILGLQPVSVIYWGGLMLNILLAVAGIAFSFPIGIALALGRRSNLPVVKVMCVIFIELFRGVPLITLLFMSQVLVPLAFPQDFPVNSLLRAAIVITLFSAAYMAENIRGGLQALHPGQAEAARALGLPSWQTMVLISLPQAIRNVIPTIVGQFISLFKDTSLVYIIGMLDIVEMGRAFIQGNTEYIAHAKELFIFLALVFWVFTYTMSYVSRHIERNLGVGQR